MTSGTVVDLSKYAVDQIQAGIGADVVAQKVAAYLLDSRQTRDMPKVMRAIENELEKRGQQQVVITSAHTVADDVKRKLADILGAKEPVFAEVIDPSVIGGVKAQSGETVIDLTVRAKLNRFKSKIAEGAK